MATCISRAITFAILLTIPLTINDRAEAEEGQGARPNILLAISDDQSWPHAGAYGCDAIKTPAFDRVARNGVIFTHAFCGASQCSVSRATLLTGRHLWAMEEAGTQGSLFPSKLPTYTDRLEAVGYHVGYTGKPWGPGNWGLDGRDTNPAGKAYNELELKPPTSKISRVDYAANFAAFLRARPEGAPFCFWYGCHEPHRDYEPGSGLRSGKRLQDAEVPPYYPANDVVRSDLLDYYLEIEWFDQHLERIIDIVDQAGELENTLIIVTSDNGMPFPRAKATLYEDGTRLPFAVQWPARLSGGSVADSLISFADVAPTILHAVGLESLQGASGSSLLPLLVGNKESGAVTHREFVLMGKERHNHARAENVGYPIRAIRTRQYLYLRNLQPDRWPMGDPPGYFCHTKMINPTKATILENASGSAETFYRLTFAKRSAEELYDIQVDPHCLKDLAADSRFAEVKRRLWIQLKQELIDQGDPRMLGYGEIFDSYPYFGFMQSTIPGFKTVGKYNADFWPDGIPGPPVR